MKTAAAKEPITPAEYGAFQEAYDFFNTQLFAGSLPRVLVTLQRHAKARGYFSPDRFSGRTEKAAARTALKKAGCTKIFTDDGISEPPSTALPFPVASRT